MERKIRKNNIIERIWFENLFLSEKLIHCINIYKDNFRHMVTSAISYKLNSRQQLWVPPF